jgi:glycosyltransferase involved in cell wall biosynthesis
MARRILFLVPDPPKPSTKQRVLDSLPGLRRRGVECSVEPIPDCPLLEMSDQRRLRGARLAARLRLLRGARHYDAVVLQKKLLQPLETGLLARANPKLVYDLDDAMMFQELDPGRVRRRARRPAGKLTGEPFRRFLALADRARVILAANRFLYELCRHNGRQVELLPTPIDVARYAPRPPSRSDGAVVVGWMGTPGNLVYLEQVRVALAALARRHPQVEFRIICARPIDLEGVATGFRLWSEAGEIEELRALDIGIMPLTDDLWTRGKSGNKILQYFGVGLPVVASPVGVNVELIDHGIDGFHARRPEEWLEHLSYLVEHPEQRELMGAKGRQKVLAEYSQERHAERLGAILTAL